MAPLRVARVASSLPLQKLLYYNYYYALAFGLSHIFFVVWKSLSLRLEPADAIALPVLVALWILFETLRLRLGYSGNLTEKVPEMAAFWLLTVLPQLPLTVFLSFVQISALMPFDVALGIPMVLLQAAQLRPGLSTVRLFIRKQTADFYRVCQEEALAKEENMLQHTGGGNGGGGAGGRLRGLGPRVGAHPASYSASPVHADSAPLSEGALDQAMGGVTAASVAREGARALLAGGGAGTTAPGGIVAATTAAAAAGTGMPMPVRGGGVKGE
jgi:transmembrane protein 17